MRAPAVGVDTGMMSDDASGENPYGTPTTSGPEPIRSARNAKFYGIGYTADGEPSEADIYQTWQRGGVVIELWSR